MRFLIIGAFSILAGLWLALSFIHSAWMSATPVPDPAPYQRHAAIYLALTVACLLLTVGAFVAWFRRLHKPQPRNEA
jgi:TRAP-type C4-dicarboxylate transport system permease small subunit